MDEFIREAIKNPWVLLLVCYLVAISIQHLKEAINNGRD